MNAPSNLNTGFPGILHANAAAPDTADKLGLYGWLVGSWEMDTVHHRDDGTIQKSTGECHFGWVLGGRAIQDVWIRPRRPASPTMYGTTLRVYDPGIDAWQIIWSDPLNQDYSRQIGRAEGNDIVQIGEDSRGLKTRWRFTEITPDSFHWIGEERSSENDAWQTAYEHFARRTSKTGFPGILHADGPAPDLADKLGLYGWLVGSWDMDVVRHQPDGKTQRGNGEIHFGWVLGGRAIQDVWIAPSRASGYPPQMFGTTLRVYNSSIDAWHIIWSDPTKQYYSRQTGRAEGKDIVQTGTDGRGENVRWRFTEITPDSFHWIGEHRPDGQDWQIEVEFFARRTSK